MDFDTVPLFKITYTVKPVLVATCIKQACIHFPKQANSLKCTCIKHAPTLSEQILIIPLLLAKYRLDCSDIALIIFVISH